MTGLIARFARLLAPYRAKVLIAFSCSAIGCSFLLVVPYLIKNLFTAALKHQSPFASLSVSLELLVLVLLVSLFIYIAHSLAFLVADLTAAELRSRCFSHLLRLPLSFFRDRRNGEIIERLTTSINLIHRFIRQDLISAMGVSLLLVGSTIMILRLNWKLAAAGILIVPAIIFTLRHLFMRVEILIRQERQEAESLNGYLQEILGGIETVKAFHAEDHEQARFSTRQKEVLKIQRKSSRQIALLDPLIVTLCALGMVMILIWGGYLLSRGELQIDTLIAFLLYILILLPQGRSLSALYLGAQQAAISLSRIDEVLSQEPELEEGLARHENIRYRGDLEIRNLSFGYEDRESALASISFQIKSGECVGIVGASGSGKTTLFNLLLHFYSSGKGSIFLDGIDIQDVPRSLLRKNISIVPQDILLFEGTISENVRYGNPAAGDDEVVAACRAAQADAFIRAMPQGYDTRVGERGVKLSGGQRQRLAIARALIKNAPILLLDEATSSLDSRTELELREAIRSAMQGRTTLIIAHRLATVVNLPRIIVLHKGHIIDEGRHEELMQRCTHYRTLVETQIIPLTADSSAREAA